MKYGEKYETTIVNLIAKERTPGTATYKRVEYGNYHTDNQGEGLWRGDKQIIGTCDFSVAGCRTEKAAKAKIRKLVTTFYETDCD